jgi:hypothetical protein
MHMGMHEKRPRIQRVRDGNDPEVADLPAEIQVNPGRRRQCSFIEPAPYSTVDAMPGDIPVPHYYANRRYRLRYDDNGLLCCGETHDTPDHSVVFLGESTLEDRYLDEERRAATVAKYRMEELTGKRVNVGNAAVSGVHSIHSLLMMLVKVIPTRPSAIVMLHNTNDLKQLMYFGSYWSTYGRHTFLRDVPLAMPQGVRRYQPRRLIAGIMRRLKRLLRHLSVQSAIAAEATKKQKAEWWEYAVPAHGFQQTDFAVLSREYARSLESFVCLCRAWGITPVLATQPNRIFGDEPVDDTVRTQMRPLFELGIDYKRYADFYQGFNLTVREVAVRLDAALIDLDQAVPKESQFIWDSVHLTRAGAERSGVAMAEILSTVLS